MTDALLKRRWRVLSLMNRPLTFPRTDPALNRVAMVVTYVFAGIGLWYFWIVRPLWVSMVLVLGYAVLSAYLVGKALSHRAG